MNPERTNRIVWLAAFALAVSLVVGAQWRLHAWQASYGAYPDESSHFIGGLLVSDYLTSGHGSSPIEFARQYYIYRPFFAIGYWPPMFYVMEGLWMTMVGHLRVHMMVYIGSIAVAIALLLFAVVRRWAGNSWGFLIMAAFLLLPSVQWSSSVVMTDLAVTLLCLAATLAVGRFFSTEHWHWALAAGVLASMAILTKYLSAFTLITPVLLLVIDRRWDLLKKKQTWIMPLIVALICGPWMWWSRNLLALGLHGYERGGIGSRFLRIVHTARLDLGLVLGLIVVTASVWVYLKWSQMSPSQRLFALQMPCTILCLLPTQVGVESRYFIPAYPGLLAMVALAAVSFGPSRWPQPVFATILVFFGLSTNPTPLPSSLTHQVAQDLLNDTGQNSAIVLPTQSEGAFIAEIASMEPPNSHHVLARPSKIFSSMTWLGGDYKLLTPDVSSMTTLFDHYPLDTVVLAVGQQPGPTRPHDLLLRQMIEQQDCWKLKRTYSDAKGNILRVYSRTSNPDASLDGLVDFLDSRISQKLVGG